MRDTDLLQTALGLPAPWTVSGSRFDATARRLDIDITFAKGARFACPGCGAPGCPVHDTQGSRMSFVSDDPEHVIPTALSNDRSRPKLGAWAAGPVIPRAVIR